MKLVLLFILFLLSYEPSPNKSAYLKFELGNLYNILKKSLIADISCFPDENSL